MSDLEDARDAAFHAPKWNVAINESGAEFSRLSITHALGEIPRAQVTFLGSPPTLTPSGILVASAAWNGIDDEAGYITAILDKPARGFNPSVYRTVTASGRSRALWANSLAGLLLGGPIADRPVNPITDETIWTELLTLTGLGDVFTIHADFEDFAFALFDTSWIEVKVAGSYGTLVGDLSAIFGREVWENPHSTLNYKRVNGLDDAPGTIYRAFTEGVNLFGLQYDEDRNALCNAIVVRATDIAVSGVFPEASTRADNSDLEDWEADRVARVQPQSGLLETQAQCEAIRDRLFPKVNRVPKTIQFRIVGDPLMAPGAFVTIDSPRVEISDSDVWVVRSVTQDVSNTGGWWTNCTGEDVYLL